MNDELNVDEPPAAPAEIEGFLAKVTHHVWGTTIAFAGGVFALAALIDFLFLSSARWSPMASALVGDALLAAIAGLLMSVVMRAAVAERRRVESRLEVIVEMNHHIRNALQVIAMQARAAQDESQIDEIKLAVNRVQWALREILPKVEPNYQHFEGSVREYLAKNRRWPGEDE